MAVRVTGGEVIRWALRLSNRWSLWQQCGPQMLTSSTSARGISSSVSRLSLVRSTRRSQTFMSGCPVSSVRYFSQGRIEGLEEKEHLSTQQSSPTEIQSGETVSERTPRRASFYDQLRECASPTDVLDVAAQFTPTCRRISNCLTQSWETTKKMTEEQRRYELQLMFEHPGFEALLQGAVQEAGRMRNEDLTYSLLATVKLGVSQRSRVVHTLLRTCQDNLNYMNEKCLSILSSGLEDMEDSPNVSALKDGLRLVVAARLPGIKKVLALQTMMRMVGKDAPLQLKKKLEIKALSMTDQFSLPNSQHMISIMASMNFYSKPLLDVCSKKIAEDIHTVPFPRLLGVLRSCKELNYRNLDLLTVISDYMASSIDMWSNKQAILILSVFEDLAFCPSGLMEAFAERVIRDPDSLTLRDLLSVLKTYSSLNHDLQDHRQQFLDSLSRALESYLSKMLSHEALKAVYCLCLLGHFPSALLEHLLQDRTLEDLRTADLHPGSKVLRGQERKLQTVDLCLRLDRPSLPQPLSVPTSVLGVPVPTNLPQPLSVPTSVLGVPVPTNLPQPLSVPTSVLGVPVPTNLPQPLSVPTSVLGVPVPTNLPQPLSVPTSVSVLGVPVPPNLSVNPSLSRTLQSVTEGVPGGTLQEMVVVENLYLIDGLITKPLAGTEGSDPAEKESSPPGNSQRIAVICPPRFAFCYGSSRPRGHLAVKIRHLKALGYTPVVVMEGEMETMSEEERTEALRKKIFPEHQGSAAEPLAD